MWRRVQQTRVAAPILDVGCETGALAEELKQFGAVVSVDFSQDALRCCQQRSLPNLITVSADALPFSPNSFTGIFCLDAVEHIEQDQQVFDEISRVVAPNGYCIFTVPAWPFLWSERDVRLQLESASCVWPKKIP